MKETLKLSELERYLKDVQWLIYDMEICRANVMSIIQAQNSGVFFNGTRSFLNHYVRLCFLQVAITTYKLFHEKEKRSFYKLFNKFENHRFDIPLNQLLNQNAKKGDIHQIQSKPDLKTLIAEIEESINEKEPTITKIKERRLKFYAHIDDNHLEIERETFKDVQEVTDLAKQIYNKLYLGFFDSEFAFQHNVASINPVINDRIKLAGQKKGQNHPF